MRKILLSLGLLSAMVLCSGALVAADDNDNKPKKGKGKGKLGDRLKGKLGQGKIDHDKLFEKLDADKDGKLTKEEFRKVFKEVGQGRFADKLGDRLDTMADRTFDRLDKDNDGKLTKDEFKEFGGLGGFGGNFDLGDLKGKLEGLKGLKDKFGKKGDKKDDKDDK